MTHNSFINKAVGLLALVPLVLACKLFQPSPLEDSTQTPPATYPPPASTTTSISLPPSITQAIDDQEIQANKVEDIVGIWLEKYAGGSAQIEIKPDGITIFTILSGANQGYQDQSKSWFENGKLRVQTDGSQAVGIYKVYITQRDGRAVEMRYELVEDPLEARWQSMTYAPLTIIAPTATPAPQLPTVTSAPTSAPIPGIDMPITIKNVSIKNSLGLTETVDIGMKILNAVTRESLKSGDESILPEAKGDIFLSLKLSLEGSLDAINWIALNVPVLCDNETYKARDTITIEFDKGLLQSWQVHYEVPADASFGSCSVQLPGGDEVPLGRFFDSPN